MGNGSNRLKRFFTHYPLPITHYGAAAVLICAVLSGCGSAPQREPVAESPPPPRGGGYYLDDGPGANPPADLDSIPDAVPRMEPLNRATSRPYVVMGRSYAPMSALQPYKARGIASWYGRRYHGKRTSSGEIYDMYAMTAAHTTLPIPSYARVTNLATGKSIVVRVNDRGPFIDGRLIDLSYTAAHKLGVLAGGSAMVEVETIIPGEPDTVALPASVPSGPDPAIAPVAAAPQTAALPGLRTDAPPAVAAPDSQSGAAGHYLQFGAFSSRPNAEQFLARMKAQTGDLAKNLHIHAHDGLFRVHAGPYSSPAEARLSADRLGQVLGMKPLLLTR